MTRRKMAGIASVAITGLMLAACGNGDTSGESSGSRANGAPASEGVIELTFWHGYTEADGDVLETIIDEFNESQSDIQISTEINPWDVIDDTLLPALSAGTGPQIVAMPAERLPVYADRGAFASLDDFYADPQSNTAALNPGAEQMIVVNETHYGVPTGFVPLALYYNKDLFAEAGVDGPPTTWDEWIDTARELTIDENGDGTPEQYGVVLPDHATVANGVWPSLFYGNGGDVVLDPATAAIDSPENAETLQIWQDAIVKDKISPTGVDGIGADELFSSERAAMTIGGPWMVFIAADHDIDLGIAPIPAGPVAQAASAIGVSMAVTSDATDEEAAAAEQFFAFFLNDENAVTWSLGSGWPPLRSDIPASEVDENPTVAELTAQAEFGRPLLPGVVNSVDVLTAVDNLTQRAMAGEDISSLLEQANAQVQSALD